MAKKEIDTSVPVFFLYVDGTHVADLSDPQREDMYWYSYLVTPTSGSANATLRDDKTWESVNFTIKDQDGQVPKARNQSFILSLTRSNDPRTIQLARQISLVCHSVNPCLLLPVVNQR